MVRVWLTELWEEKAGRRLAPTWFLPSEGRIRDTLDPLFGQLKPEASQI